MSFHVPVGHMDVFFEKKCLFCVCFFLINSHSNGCKVVLIAVWIHIFLMISSVEHIFKSLLAGCLYMFFGEMCIQFFPQFLIKLLILLLL